MDDRAAHMILLGAANWYVGRSTIGAHAVADDLGDLLPQLMPSTRDLLARDVRRRIDDLGEVSVGGIDDLEPWRRLLGRIGDAS